MNNDIEIRTQSSWRVGSWFQRIHHLLGNPRAGVLGAPVLPLTRRQALLAAQDLKKCEQRSRENALLREIKRKGRYRGRDQGAPHRITKK